MAVALRDNGVYHVEVIDLANWKSIYSTDSKTFWLVLDLSPDGRQLAIVTDTREANQLQVVDLDTGKAASTFQSSKKDEGDVFVSAVEYGPSGDILALACSDGRIQIYNQEGKFLYEWQAHQGEIALAFSRDGKFLATNSRDGLIKIWGIGP